MTKLNQIIAVEKGVKSETNRKVTDLHRDVQKPQLLSGLTRTYAPRADDGDAYPGESTEVQLNAEDVLADLAAAMTRLFDVTLTKDTANAAAAADVVVDGDPLLRNVPVTYLLFLEKQLTDLGTFVDKLPVLDPASHWDYDTELGCWVTPPAMTVKSKKVPEKFVLYEATKEHPAQVQVFTQDVPEGDWTTVKFSGALSPARVRALHERVVKLQHAVKFAREEANGHEVTDAAAGEAVFRYLFAR